MTGKAPYKRHVSGALHSPFVILFEQQCADESDDGVVVGEDADDLGSSLDLAIETLDRIRAVKLGPMLLRECHVGEHVGLGVVHDGGELRHFWPDLVGDGTPLNPGGLGRLLGEGSGDEGGDDPSSALAGMR